MRPLTLAEIRRFGVEDQPLSASTGALFEDEPKAEEPGIKICEPIQTTCLIEWLKKYILHRRGTIAARTEDGIAKEIWRFIDQLQGAPLSPKVIEQHYAYLMDAGLSKSSASRAMFIIKKWLEWAVEEGLAPYNPDKYAVYPRHAKRNVVTRRLTIQQYNTLKKGMPRGFWRSVLIIGYNTGLRKSDLIRLQWSHVDMERGVIEIVPKKTERYGKKSIIPVVPGSDLALELIQLKRQSKSPYVLGEARGLKTKSLSDKFQRDCRRVIPGLRISLHDLRRSFITNMVSSGVEARVVCSVCAIGETQLPHYWVPNQEAHRMAMSKLHNFMSNKETAIIYE